MNTHPFDIPPPPPALAPALQRLRQDLAAEPVPASVWRRTREALADRRLAAPAPWWRSAITGLAVGSAAIAWVTLVWFRLPAPAPGAEPGLGVPTLLASGFVPVAAPERFDALWAGDARTASAWLVHTELPREQLAVLGLPYDPARAGEPVRAELLMHPAGDVLAVRLTR